jgi:N-acetylglucosaminyl-diphospho-decaprenol L-rhamnosyltransferase
VTTLAIVIVSWNVRELLRRCLRAVAASMAGSGIPYEVVVVDNASGDGTLAMLRAEFPAVRLLEPGSNLGFAGGNNLALRYLGHRGGSADAGAPGPVSSSHSPAPYVLLLNPDTEPLGDAIPRLVLALEARPELLAVGPQLRYPDGAVQPSRRRFPRPLTLLWESTPLERLWPGNPWARRYRCADAPDDAPQPVGWLVGAALLVRSAAIARAGLLDERFFMYSEELEWQHRLQHGCSEAANSLTPHASRLRSRIWYLPDAVVIHHEGKSSEQAVARRHINFNRSKLLLARMWYGWRFAALLRRLLRLGFRYELAIEAAKLYLGHRPELRRQRVAVYREVLREL